MSDEKLFQAMFDKASSVGYAAGRDCAPTPMVVDDGRKRYYVADGVCGFAWVHIAPATSRFARWLLKTKRAHKAYYGGCDIWISAHNQSYDRKMAHARAMAEELKLLMAENNITYKYAYSDGRLD